MTEAFSLERKSTERKAQEPWSVADFEAAIRAVGAERYHDKHPFHHMLHGGQLKKPQVQAWALNRYCYQSAVPRKDAALVSRLYDRELRREWIHRLLDHDGYGEEPGGIERWLILTDGLGLDRDYVISMRGALPAIRAIGSSLATPASLGEWPVRVLAVIGADTGGLQPDQEVRELCRLLRRQDHVFDCEVFDCSAVDAQKDTIVAQLKAKLGEFKPHILHFAGHASFGPSAHAV